MTLREEVQGFLKAHRVRLNTDLGQHFLVDEDTLETIVECSNVVPEEHVVEIGPGIGILTRELLNTGARVTAIELDGRLIPLLRSFIRISSESSKSQPSSLEVIQGNALQTPLPSDPYKIIANIPYHITSPLLRHIFLESERSPESLTLLIQREVAETICNAENAGILTILVGLFGEPRFICKVPPGSFLPPPAVDSAVLHVECFRAPRADREIIDRIFTLTKVGFGQKRKMLRNTLGNLPEGMDRMRAAGIDPARRPQTLSAEEWITLAGLF